MSKKKALVVGGVVLILVLVLVRPHPFRWWQVREAKLWCEELAVLMEQADRERLQSDRDYFRELQDEVGWTPRLFAKAHTLGWDVHDEGVGLTFQVPKGERDQFVGYSYRSATGEWTIRGDILSPNIRAE